MQFIIKMDMMTDGEFRLSVPFLNGAEVVAYGFIQEVCRLFGVSEPIRDEISFALVEAVLNAIRHSRSEERRVYIAVEYKNQEVRIIVRDHGEGFNVSGTLTEVSKQVDPLQRKGWGLFLIQSLMDETRILSSDRGTQITLVKKIK